MIDLIQCHVCQIQLLAPTTILKSKTRPNDSDDPFKLNENSKLQHKKQTTITTQALAPPNKAVNDYDWNVVDEYNPLWPNEYDKIIKERRERRDHDRKRRNRNETRESPPQKYSGFGGRTDDADDYKKSPPPQRPPAASFAAIAPPPSLQESTPIIPALQNANVSNSYGGGSVAAKIMAKYGFKDGQGLGKQEQGMSIALQVEKTSKRGGRIIHENEFLQPARAASPPTPSMLPPPPVASGAKDEPSITEIMKAPSKVVLLRVSV